MKKLIKKKMAVGGPVKKPKKQESGPIDAGVDPALLNATIFGKDKNMSTDKFLKKVGESDVKMKSEAAKKSMPKKKMGGSLKPVDKSKKPGLAKLPKAVRNKMGYQKMGGKSKKK